MLARIILFVISACCLGAFAWSRSARAYYQWRLSEILREEERAAPGPDAHIPAPVGFLDAPLGRIEIPRLRASAVIVDGVDSSALRVAVGHIPGTAYPGQSGNIGLAAHRDSFFRRLDDLRPKDRIRLSTPDGHADYIVSFTRVVDPSQADLLRPSTQSMLTLVTCYPFTYIGSAPKRFVVRAQVASI
jgi:LPXTG-site transpeptidase (sortase) family protein